MNVVTEIGKRREGREPETVVRVVSTGSGEVGGWRGVVHDRLAGRDDIL